MLSHRIPRGIDADTFVCSSGARTVWDESKKRRWLASSERGSVTPHTSTTPTSCFSSQMLRLLPEGFLLGVVSLNVRRGAAAVVDCVE
mmetsp:Transcript_12968/g.40265  ORF Transcript_12968/g.40265 Transcript_12968/m.40265 type:complete len:88 (+) Transcript_12968:658-921(+)